MVMFLLAQSVVAPTDDRVFQIIMYIISTLVMIVGSLLVGFARINNGHLSNLRTTTHHTETNLATANTTLALALKALDANTVLTSQTKDELHAAEIRLMDRMATKDNLKESEDRQAKVLEKFERRLDNMFQGIGHPKDKV